MLQMQEVNIFFPATLVSASVSTIGTISQEMEKCRFTEAFHYVSRYISQDRIRKTEVTPDISNFTQVMEPLRSHIKISDSWRPLHLQGWKDKERKWCYWWCRS